MKAVIQRVLSAAVEAEGERIASVGRGFLLLLGVTAEDDEAAAARLAVSNFTLCADCRHGRRPEFLSAARPERAEPLYRRFVEQLRINGVREVETGRFGADMRVSMEGDGPVTILLDTAEWARK